MRPAKVGPVQLDIMDSLRIGRTIEGLMVQTGRSRPSVYSAIQRMAKRDLVECTRPPRRGRHGSTPKTWILTPRGWSTLSRADRHARAPGVPYSGPTRYYAP